MPSDTKYLYAASRIKVLETRLLGRNTFERMLEAPKAEDTLKILSETEYGAHFGDVENVYDFEKAVNSELKKAYKVVADSTREPLFSMLFTLKHDFHNLKVLLKGEYLDEGAEGITVDMGSFPLERMARAVREKTYDDMPKVLKEAAEAAVMEFELHRNPQQIDLILDRCLYDELYNIAVRLGYEFVVLYISTQIDLLNINAFLRAKRAGFDIRFLETALLNHGTLDKSVFTENYYEPLNAFAEKLVMGRYGNIAKDGILTMAETKSSTRLEKLLDDYLLGLAQKGKSTAFGVEPVIGYLAAKENEAKIIRTIMVGKINEIPVETIRERLRDVYV
jgi:V/A-type H+-transporting ATPase subunit C